MDCAFGVAGEDWVLIASDRSVMRSIIKLQDTDDKLRVISDNQIIATCGEVSDRKEFSKLINGEIDYYYYRYNNRLNTDELANYTRSILAENLRKKPYQVNCLIAGFDQDGAKLYWMDYLGSSQRVLKGAHGYGGHFMYGIMDNFHRNGWTVEEGKKCIRACIDELKTRFLINMVDFTIYLINKDGISNLSDQFNKKQ